VKLREDFFDEEVICGYRVYGGTKEVWAVNLGLLDFFKGFCEKQGLRYFMGFGTLLGAVRHQGFIPWDDDVDVIMPREDFERLKKMASEIKKPYFLQTEDTDPGFWHGGLIKLRNSDTACIEQKNFDAEFNQGIALDILPLDYAAETPLTRKWQSLKIFLYQYLIIVKYYSVNQYYVSKNRSWFQKICDQMKWGLFSVVGYFFREEYLRKKLFFEQTKYQNKNALFCGIYTSLCWIKKWMAVDTFLKTVHMRFENLYLPAPCEVRICLENQYGKYFLHRVDEKWRLPRHPSLWAVDANYISYLQRFRDVFKNTKGKNIVLFGTGNMIWDYHKKTKGRFRPIFYVDNNSTRWGSEIDGIMVKSPLALKEIAPEQLHLIICNNYYREIGKQLLEMGIENYYVYTDNFPILFGTPNDIGVFNRKKMYSRGCICFYANEYSLDIHKALKKAKMKSENLMVVLLESSMKGNLEARKIVSLLQNIEFVEGVLFGEELNVEDLRKLYLVDAIFLITGNKHDFGKEAEANGLSVEYIR